MLNIVMRAGSAHGSNTLDDLRNTMAAGLDAEMDFSLTADGHLVAGHDGNEFRETYGALTREIHGRPVLRLPSGAVAPYLNEAIAEVRPGRRLFVDIKATAYGGGWRERALAAALAAVSEPARGEIVVMAYEWPEGTASAFHARGVATAIKHNGQMTEAETVAKIERGRANGATWACLELPNMHPAAIEAARAAGIGLILPVWGSWPAIRDQVEALAGDLAALITPYPEHVARLSRPVEALDG